MHLPCGPCTIRSWRPDDLDALLHHANNARVARELRDRFPHPYTRPDGQAWLALVPTMQPETAFVIAVEDELVGGIGVVLSEDCERVSGEIGYWLGEQVWGQGLATAAVSAFTSHALATYGLTRLFALPFARNLASRRVLEKAGFRLVGILRHSAIKQGEVIDQALYDLVKE
jgi:RimJ/RimL family protein N-acetyltransferase